MYISHMRSEGDRLLESVDELIEISRRSGAPAEIYHLKQAGRSNWGKLDAVIAQGRGRAAPGPADHRRHVHLHGRRDRPRRVDAAVGAGWWQRGNAQAAEDPAVVARIKREMVKPGKDWENLVPPCRARRRAAREPGRAVAEASHRQDHRRGRQGCAASAPSNSVDRPVLADKGRAGAVYFLMSEDNVRRQTAMPWMSFGSDAEASAPEGVFLKSSTHPRAYGNFARFLGKYVRDDKGRAARRCDPPPDRLARATILASRTAAGWSREWPPTSSSSIRRRSPTMRPSTADALFHRRARRVRQRRAGADGRRADRRDARALRQGRGLDRLARRRRVPAAATAAGQGLEHVYWGRADHKKQAPGCERSPRRRARAPRKDRPPACLILERVKGIEPSS